MSEVRAQYPPKPFEDVIQLFDDTLAGLPWHALWWRQPLLRNENGQLYVVSFDNADNPTEIVVTFYEGETNESATPFALKVMTEPVFPPINLVRQASKAWVDDVTTYLDVLSADPPTSSRRWYALTAPGCHIHPDDRKSIEAFRLKVLALRMIRVDDE